MTDLVLHQLKDQKLYREKLAYINGEWVPAKGGKTFDVIGKYATLLARALFSHVYQILFTVL